MKKFLSVVVLLTILALSLFGCSSVPPHFKGEWKFSQISKVELSPDVSQNDLDALKERYSVDTEEGVLTAVLAQLVADETFNPYYIKFDKKKAYTYNALFVSETTWAFYQTDENEGFISYNTELDASLGNPFPDIFPEITYKADSDTLVIVERYNDFYMVTLELKR